MANRTNRTPKKEAQFLKALRATGVVTTAAQAIGAPRRTVYEWREQDSEFAKAWDEALEEALDMLEVEARRRAHDGLIKKKFGKDGEPIIDPETGQQYCEREYSDTLMIFLLKGGRPEKYRENIKQEQSGEVVLRVEYGDNGSQKAND